MTDPEELADIARRRIAATPGFSDLADFYVSFYYPEDMGDIDEEDRGWVGQYVSGSLESDRGPIVLINLTAIDDDEDADEAVISTICHEMGHALWTLVNKKDQQRWKRKHRDVRWGPEEAFADDFMWLTSGNRTLMTDEDLFLEIARAG